MPPFRFIHSLVLGSGGGFGSTHFSSNSASISSSRTLFRRAASVFANLDLHSEQIMINVRMDNDQQVCGQGSPEPAKSVKKINRFGV